MIKTKQMKFLLLIFLLFLSLSMVLAEGEWPSLEEEEEEVRDFPSVTGKAVAAEKTPHAWRNYLIYISIVVSIYILFKIIVYLKLRSQ